MHPSSCRFCCRNALNLAMVFALASGCVTTRSEGDQLRVDVDALKTETAQLQKQLSDLNARAGGRVEKIEAGLGELEATLGALRQANADSGVQFEKIVAEVQLLRGEVQEAKHEIGEQKASVESILARPPVAVASAVTAPKLEDDSSKVAQIEKQEVPAAAKAHYDFAKSFFDDKKFGAAAEAFDLFLVRHGKEEEIVDTAAFWKAESYFQLGSAGSDKAAKEKAFKQAILSYQRVLETPKSEKSPGALLKIGLSFEQLGFFDEARVFYEELITKHEKSPLVPDAKKRLKTLNQTKKKTK